MTRRLQVRSEGHQPAGGPLTWAGGSYLPCACAATGGTPRHPAPPWGKSTVCRQEAQVGRERASGYSGGGESWGPGCLGSRRGEAGGGFEPALIPSHQWSTRSIGLKVPCSPASALTSNLQHPVCRGGPMLGHWSPF